MPENRHRGKLKKCVCRQSGLRRPRKISDYPLSGSAPWPAEYTEYGVLRTKNMYEVDYQLTACGLVISPVLHPHTTAAPQRSWPATLTESGATSFFSSPNNSRTASWLPTEIMSCSSRRFVLFVVVAVFSITSLVGRHRVATVRVGSTKEAFKAPKHNVWADLTKDEAASVYDFLDHEWAHLNLTKTPDQLRDNYVYSLETLQPNKSQVLPYLWQNHDAPERWSKIALASFDDGQATLAYHAVGPLPISPKTRALHLTYPFNGRNRIRNPMAEFVSVMEFSTTLGENISDITTELLNAKINRNNTEDPDGLLVHPSVASLRG